MRFRFAARRGGILPVVPLLALITAASPAAAHSELRGSIPAPGAVLDCPPDQIELQFNESVQLTALRLYRVDGEEVELPRRDIREAKVETIALPPLEPGDFQAEWRIISSDGHPVGGSILFSISEACPS